MKFFRFLRNAPTNTYSTAIDKINFPEYINSASAQFYIKIMEEWKIANQYYNAGNKNETLPHAKEAFKHFSLILGGDGYHLNVIRVNLNHLKKQIEKIGVTENYKSTVRNQQSVFLKKIINTIIY